MRNGNRVEGRLDVADHNNAHAILVSMRLFFSKIREPQLGLLHCAYGPLKTILWPSFVLASSRRGEMVFGENFNQSLDSVNLPTALNLGWQRLRTFFFFPVLRRVSHVFFVFTNVCAFYVSRFN